MRTAIATEIENPHEILGIGGDRDVMVAGRLAVRDAVFERIESARLLWKGEVTMAQVGCAGILVKDTFCGPLPALPRPGN